MAGPAAGRPQASNLGTEAVSIPGSADWHRKSGTAIINGQLAVDRSQFRQDVSMVQRCLSRCHSALQRGSVSRK